MCFSPQRRAIFQHLNFKKCSDTEMFCTFSLENVLLATAACNFSTSQLQKVLRTPQFFSMFTSKCASRHSGVQFLISPLTTWLRTRRFNEPTFRLTRHTNHWKNTAFRDFSNIWRGCIFFLLTFALLHLLSSDSTSSSDFTFFWLYFIYLLFICFSTLHIVGSLLFKLPSIIYIYVCVYDVYVPYHIHTKYCINPLSFCDTGLPNNSFAKTHASPTWPRLALGQVVIIPQKNRGGRDPLDDQSVGLSKRVRIQKSGI